MSVMDVVDIKGSITGINGFDVVRGYKSHVINDARNKIIIIVGRCFEKNCFCFMMDCSFCVCCDFKIIIIDYVKICKWFYMNVGYIGNNNMQVSLNKYVFMCIFIYNIV